LGNYKTHVLDDLICIKVVRLEEVYFCIFSYRLDGILCFCQVLFVLVEQSEFSTSLYGKGDSDLAPNAYVVRLEH
jgi:hypothetical protein